jgi:hypothetical protein
VKIGITIGRFTLKNNAATWAAIPRRKEKEAKGSMGGSETYFRKW